MTMTRGLDPKPRQTLLIVAAKTVRRAASVIRQSFPYMLTADGRPVIERLAEMNLLPSPESAKVVPLK
jgi:hypothetical protein